MEFQQSKTYQNLQTALNEELMASTRYSIYGDIARNEGYAEIGYLYDIAVRNEKEHARIWLRQIGQGSLPTLTEALQQSSVYEGNIARNMYQDFARVANEEGFNDIAALFNGVANIDYYHSDNFNTIYKNIESGQELCKPEKTLWICTQCGNILFGDCAPTICPVCGFPQGYYRLLHSNIIY